MRYYAVYDDDRLVSIGKGPGGTEITESEYNALLEEILANLPVPEPAGDIIDDSEALAIITGGEPIDS